MTVLANEELISDATGLWDFTREAPRGPTRHLTVRLPDDVTYASGDHLAVYPRNADDRVDALVRRFADHITDIVDIVGVIADAARHLVGAIAAVEFVSPFAALQGVAAAAALQQIVALAALQQVGAL